MNDYQNCTNPAWYVDFTQGEGCHHSSYMTFPLRLVRVSGKVVGVQLILPPSTAPRMVCAGVGQTVAVPSGMEESPGSIGQGAR